MKRSYEVPPIAIATAHSTFLVFFQQNRGTCDYNVTSTGSLLVDVPCECPAGVIGSHCEQEENGCANNPCFPGKYRYASLVHIKQKRLQKQKQQPLFTNIYDFTLFKTNFNFWQTNIITQEKLNFKIAKFDDDEQAWTFQRASVAVKITISNVHSLVQHWTVDSIFTQPLYKNIKLLPFNLNSA